MKSIKLSNLFEIGNYGELHLRKGRTWKFGANYGNLHIEAPEINFALKI